MPYSERQNLVWWVRYLIILVFVGFILGLSFTFSDPKTPSWVSPFITILVLFFLLIFINFRTLEIKVDGRFLEFGFGIFRKKIALSDIIFCEESKVTFGKYGGIGIRWGFGGTICYNTRFGKGVRIKIKDKRKDYVLTSDNPQALCQAIKTG
ncbi:MAG: hypothetical protein Q8O10_04920 [candidate division Zixibacteria bacterium]|nr:hypothetical protein [candidate division Zixibacteria bacterium]